MITILIDHDIEGQALTLWGTLAAEGWLTLLPMQLATFAQVGLRVNSSDRTVWRTAQAQGMVLLTQNRNMKGEDFLEQTIREDNTSISLWVVTIGRIDRIRERSYRKRCAIRPVEIGLDIENYLGTGRIFIP